MFLSLNHIVEPLFIFSFFS